MCHSVLGDCDPVMFEHCSDCRFLCYNYTLLTTKGVNLRQKQTVYYHITYIGSETYGFRVSTTPQNRDNAVQGNSRSLTDFGTDGKPVRIRLDFPSVNHTNWRYIVSCCRRLLDLLANFRCLQAGCPLFNAFVWSERLNLRLWNLV